MKSKGGLFMLSVGAVFSLATCSPVLTNTKTDVQPLVSAPQKPPEYRIQPGDQLDIKFFYNPQINETVVVRPDGKISLQVIDDTQAAGLTPTELDETLTQKYSEELQKPAVTVIVRSFTGQQVYVGGEVNRPGLISLVAGLTTLQAVISAGGLRETAKPEGAIVIRKGQDNKPMSIGVNLTQAIYGKGEGAGLRLQPSDIVYVPKSTIAKVNKFVNQYVEQLLLFRGVSFGFTYELNPSD